MPLQRRPVTRETAELTDDLTIVLDRAVSRLRLLDGQLHEQKVHLVWMNDMLIGVFTSSRVAEDVAQSIRNRPEFRGHPWKKYEGVLRWSNVVIARLEVEERTVQGPPSVQ